MSLHKKSQEVLYSDFIDKTLGGEDSTVQKKLKKTGFQKTIAHIEKSEAYDKYVVPCLSDINLIRQSKATNKTRAIEKKLKLLEKRIQIKDFFFYQINLRARKIRLLYGRSSKGKIKQSHFTRQLVMDDALLRVLRQKKVSNAKLEASLKETLSWLDQTEIEGCFFHLIKKGSRPEAVIVMRPGSHFSSYDNVETPLGSLIDLAFSADTQLKDKAIEKDEQELLVDDMVRKITTGENSAISGNLHTLDVMKNFMRHLSSFIEELAAEKGLDAFLSVFKIQGFIVFEAFQVEVEEPEDKVTQSVFTKEDFENESIFEGEEEIALLKAEKAIEASDDDTEAPDQLFNIVFSHAIDETELVIDIKVPSLLLTEDEKLLLHDKVFRNENFLIDKQTMLLEVSSTKKILIVIAHKDFENIGKMDFIPASVFFQSLLAGMLHFYHSRF